MNFYKLFNPGCRVILFGQYNNGKKFGQWDIYQHKRKIGGGTYNDEGKKVGQWKEISLNFSQDFEVFYSGHYEQGIRQGNWSIIFQDRQIGGGQYDLYGMKHGFWNDAHKNYSYRIQIVYQGEYSHGWKKGRWNILLKDQIIGGGVYDKGVRQGKWVDIDEYYTDYRQVQCEGDYLNGKKNGQWDLIFQGLVIGGGEYKDGIKNGKWIILDSKWKPFEQQFKQVIYQNGMQQSSK